MAEHIQLTSDAAKNVQAYIDYCNIVGGADGGKMMSEKEFEEYKEKVKYARQNHLYTSWRNSKGNECKLIGPASMCFCNHRYKDHAFDNVDDKNVHCLANKCKCPLFNHIPICKGINRWINRY